MDLLTRIRDEMLPFAELLGIEFVSASPEKIVAEMTVREDLCTRPAVLHGGAIMAFADTLGATGTIVVTSAVWAAIHLQYDWLGIAQIFCLGLLFGWVRWRSGSTALTILMHAATNVAATVETAVILEWLS